MMLSRRSPSLFRLISSDLRPFSSSSSSSSSSYAGSDGLHLSRSLAGIVAVGGSALGFWLLPSPFGSSSDAAFADAGYDSDQRLEARVSEKKPMFIFGESYRKRVFFKYEKRIRMQSPAEKIFEYFASFRSPDGEVFMLPADLMRAVVPVFPPSESDIIKGGYLRGEHHPGDLHCAPSTFFMLFDTNSDGLISFPEYIFLVTLLSIPESSFSAAFKMFDLDHNGEIEMEEFKKVMRMMQSYNRLGSRHSGGLFGKSLENGGLMVYFFGEDGKGRLNHDKFVQFLRDLHDEIVRLEFAHYDFKSRGTISAKDFALSMVASADINHINKFLDRVDELDDHPHLRDACITLDEFKTFAELRRSLQPLALAIFSYGKVNGLLTKQDFQRAASRVCGISMSDKVVDVIFHVFDANRDGNLSSDEFLRALQRRESDIRHETGVPCWKKCSKKQFLHKDGSIV